MKIIEAPSEALSAVSSEVKVPFPADLSSILTQMEEALRSAKDPKGVGLAAPQAGIALRIFITKPTEKSKTAVFINPKILATGGSQLATGKQGARGQKPVVRSRRQKKLEGCLSLHSIWGDVKRAPSVKLSFLDGKGRKHAREFKGFMATIVQHEIDHLDGILFPRRVLEQKGKLYKSSKNEKNEDIFDEIEL